MNRLLTGYPADSNSAQLSVKSIDPPEPLVSIIIPCYTVFVQFPVAELHTSREERACGLPKGAEWFDMQAGVELEPACPLRTKRLPGFGQLPVVYRASNAVSSLVHCVLGSGSFFLRRTRCRAERVERCK